MGSVIRPHQNIRVVIKDRTVPDQEDVIHNSRNHQVDGALLHEQPHNSLLSKRIADSHPT